MRTLHFLQPLSPDFNPIERAFSKLKAMLRKIPHQEVNYTDDDYAGEHKQLIPHTRLRSVGISTCLLMQRSPEEPVKILRSRIKKISGNRKLAVLGQIGGNRFLLLCAPARVR